MKIEKQVCSLSQAVKLKELGLKQESLFSYIHKGEYYCGEEYCKPNNSFITEGCIQNLDFPYRFDGCAFTVSELANILPMGIKSGANYHPLNIFHFQSSTYAHKSWVVEYHETFYPPLLRIQDENMAICMAEALITLIEKGQFSVSKFNDLVN